MYIANAKLINYRNFDNLDVEFNDGVNVIIGHNNAGKSNLLNALSIVLDHSKSKKLDIDDFYKLIPIANLKAAPPKITIELTIRKGEYETDDDLVTIATWLTKLEDDYEAKLTYEFFLQEKHHEAYKKQIADIPVDSKQTQNIWDCIKHDFLRLYVSKIWAGNIVNQATADSEALQKFDFQFLDAIRDVQRDMLTGKNTLLRDVLDFFMDYDIKSDPSKNNEEKYTEIKSRKQAFSQKAQDLIADLDKRIMSGKQEILSYAKDTGASFNNATPNFEGNISESELYSVLKLIVEYETGIKIPATRNGLGYNNLIFMSLLLAKMQINSDEKYLDSNAKVFSLLVIEEPEAHLHPSMQYKFLKFLDQNKRKRKVRQVFVTSHSTNITSAVTLNEIICLHSNKDGKTIVGYPSKTFTADDGQPVEDSKKYVERFLDASRSDMLFGQKVLFVEGLAEQLLISVLANYENSSIEDHHISIINTGGRYFKHFLYLFDSTKQYTIGKKIVCLTDRDPERKDKMIKNGSFRECYPYELNTDPVSYDYKQNSFCNEFIPGSHQNITVFTQDQKLGKTFEYDIAFYNPSLKLLLTDSIQNKLELENLMDLYDNENSTLESFFEILRKSDENKRIEESITKNTTFTSDEKKKAIIASRYLNSIGKGENALELAITLKRNLEKKGTPDYKEFIIPEYIKQAITELCQ
ncbi:MULTISPECIES: ATP-dependent nuclease [Elizabethkingia]|uniref:ATP-dependent endonuclease n=1 Tax=Elizabethkingia ursingii TaxID=1756150 RepID=A0AAJ3NCT9_9FLAO|nr:MULTISPECIES: AAA family ATPase [Elizabethkingia]AQW92883.1 ATP-dependent endonuclease [Elizabethkingia anophelis]AQX09827.1 ATP-dependent endonuclease [Elizabethkingia ursingii]OPB65702.1 ATP-dependent endonuclease [Elizabethkingia anophelis]OPB75970.1 ATP-dependent endonuclease [Elizabethkingia ursingii]OPB84637.1 ATP-dependent endonuclease [Elizabethkingia ursingii]